MEPGSFREAKGAVPLRLELRLLQVPPEHGWARQVAAVEQRICEQMSGREVREDGS